LTKKGPECNAALHFSFAFTPQGYILLSTLRLNTGAGFSMATSTTASPDRDFELECLLLGPSTRLLLIESDPQGGVYYKFGKREPRVLQLPPAYGGRWLGLIDMTQAALLIDLQTQHLLALAVFTAFGNQVILLGREWGRWVDENGEMRRSDNIPDLLRRLKAAVAIDERRQLLSIDYQMNMYNREGYSREALAVFREGARLRHLMVARFAYPDGAFFSAQVEVREGAGERLRMVFDLKQMPFAWPALPAEASPVPQTEMPASDEGEDLLAAALRRKRERLAQARHEEPKPRREAAPKVAPERPPAPKPAGRGPTPMPRTEHLPTQALLEYLDGEDDEVRRWKIIEPNLMLGRPERTYPLILRHADLLASRTKDWPASRLKVAFAHQPAAVLDYIMQPWSNNQILAVMEEHAESGRILDWLAEREVERLLALKIDKEPVNASEARGLLGVDRNADPSAIKKVWRTLLGMLNADHGRSQERAIHRRKDEIAKHLQLARNILMAK
jgi:hypothetical protein